MSESKKRSKNNWGTGRKTLKRKILTVVCWVVGIIFLLVAGVFTWLTITEYKPADVETVAVEGAADPVKESGSKNVTLGDRLTVMSWNIHKSGKHKQR